MTQAKPQHAELKENLTICFILVIMGFAMTYLWCTGCRTSTEWFFKISGLTISLWISLWMGNAYTSDWISKYVSWTAEPIKRFWIGMVVMVIYTTSVVYLLIWIFRDGLGVDMGSSSGMIYGSLGTTFVISTFMHGRGFLVNWKQAALEAETAKRESLKAQYEALKNQVNPHFLFNSLNVLTNLVYDDADKAARFIKKLSDVYRYVLDTRDKEVVPLEEEMAFVESYVYLQQIRFGANLQVKYAVPSTQGNVVPLSLQMLVENAIKHNEVSTDHPLTIEILRLDNIIEVNNPVQPKVSPVEPNSGLGLGNIQRRYEFLSREPVSVRQENGMFRVKLPILTV